MSEPVKIERKKCCLKVTARLGSSDGKSIRLAICGFGPWATVVVVVCRDPAYSGSTAYADLGNIYSLY